MGHDLSHPHPRGVLRVAPRYQAADGRPPGDAGMHPADGRADQPGRHRSALPAARRRDADRRRLAGPAGQARGRRAGGRAAVGLRPRRSRHAGGPVRRAGRARADGAHRRGAPAMPGDHEHAPAAVPAAASRAVDAAARALLYRGRALGWLRSRSRDAREPGSAGVPAGRPGEERAAGRAAHQLQGSALRCRRAHRAAAPAC